MSSARAQSSPLPAGKGNSKGRSPLAHLLHALNQPLTGLQCSLELAVAGPRPSEQYIRTLQEGLELTGRMRILVEAIREVADTPPPDRQDVDLLRLDELLGTTVTDLLPVAQAKGVRLSLVNQSPLPLRADRRSLTTLLFRFLDSVLSLAREGSDLRIVAAPDQDEASLVVSWNPGPPPEHSPFSRPEVGLLLAQVGWERAGAEWIQTRTGSTGGTSKDAAEKTTEVCTVRLPLAPALAAL
jgi:signal transduction histidine kinase